MRFDRQNSMMMMAMHMCRMCMVSHTQNVQTSTDPEASEPPGPFFCVWAIRELGV